MAIQLLEADVMRSPTTGTTRAMRLLGTVALMMASTRCTASKPVTDPQPAPTGSASSTSSASDATLRPDRNTSTQQYTRVEELIEARAPGVKVIRTNGSYSLQIRGVSSPSGSTDPLIVVDGSVSSQPGTRALDGINPNDVVKVEVLKDAASTAFYGMRGASGVILITTRKQ